MPAKKQVEKERTSAVGKAFAVLRVLRRSAMPITLTSVAEQVGIAPSSAHSVLMQLLKEGAVTQDADKRYQLGPTLFYIGSSFARGTPIYRSIWMELVEAANELAVTAALAVEWEQHHLVLSAHRGGNSDVAVPFGGRVPIFASSWGKVYYAWSGAPLPSELSRFTDRSTTDVATFKAEVESTREAGYAIDRGEFSEGVGGVAAPVTSSMGYEGLASFLAPLETVERIGFEALGRRLSGLAARASLSLGDAARLRRYGFE